MNRNIRGIAAAVAGIGMAAVLAASPAAATPIVGNWGLWEVSPLTSYDQAGSVAFADTAQGSLGYTISWDALGSDGYAYTETANEKGDWVPAGSAPAAIFGASGPSDTENMLILDSSSPTTATMTVTFKEPVAANDLGFVVVDIDSSGASDANESDRVTLEATTADNTSLTSAELNAGVFQTCDVPVADMPDSCGGTTDTRVPTLTEPTATSVYFEGDLTADNDGSSGWINPTVAVKSVTLTWTGNDGGSTIRVFAAVKPKPALANTGVDVTSGLLAALAFGVLGAAAVIITRRRQA
jgi:LPXTG-motif cell wall-anchored protein